MTDAEKLTLPKGVLWDMDGTLVNSEPFWIEGQFVLAKEHGVTWTEEDALATVGTPLPVSASILQAAGIDLPIEAIIRHQIAYVEQSIANAVPWQPGARELLQALGEAGIPCAIVTMAYRSVAEIIVRNSPEGTFQAVVAGDEVTHGKPHAEPYLTGAAKIGVDPAECVAIEDSLIGAMSAEAAGVPILVVPAEKPVPAGPGRSRVASLTEIGLAELARIVNRQPIDTIGD